MRYLTLLFIGCLLAVFPIRAQEEPVVDSEVIAGLVADLNHADWLRREQALKQLKKLPKSALAELRRHLDGPLTAEQRRRLETVMTALGDLTDMDRKILREILRSQSLTDLLSAYATYGDALKEEAVGTMLKGEKKVDLELEQTDPAQGTYSLKLDLDEECAAWIPGDAPVLDMRSSIPFPRVKIKGGGDDLIEVYIGRAGEASIYSSSGGTCRINGNFRRFIGPDPVFATLQVTRRYVPGTFKFRLQAWGRPGELDILTPDGKTVDTVRKAGIRASHTVNVEVDPFDDYNISVPAVMNANNWRNYDFNISAKVPEEIEAGSTSTLELQMTPFSRQANYFFILPEFKGGKFTTIFWRRMGKDEAGKPKVLEQITQRLDPREEVTFDPESSEYVSLYTLQTVQRNLELKAPETPGEWEMVICYGAFCWNGRVNVYQPFTMLRQSRSYGFVPMGVLPSKIYKVLIK